MFGNAELREKTRADPSVKLYNSERVEVFVNLLPTPVLYTMLVLPIVTMFRLNISMATSIYMSSVVVLILLTLSLCRCTWISYL